MIGVHPSPRTPLVPPQPLHVELVAWFSPDIPPATDRTVIVRVEGLPGSWPAFHTDGTWFDGITGGQIDAAVLAWAEQPSGIPPRTQPQLQAGAAIAKLTLATHGYSLRLNAAGAQLAHGVYELQLAAPLNPRSPA